MTLKAGKGKSLKHNLTIAAGPIGDKQRDFIFNEDFKEMAFIGTWNTGKSTALVDWLIISGLDYPGANLVLTRAKLSDLRRTTLTKYLSRAGTVLVDDYNKNEAVISFPEINGKVSKLYLFGLDRSDLEEVLKSFEPFRAAVEEANEVPNKALDMLLGRCRQKVEHRYRTNRELVRMRAELWGVPEVRAQAMLKIPDEKLDEPCLGPNQLKYVFNPEGNDHTWKRSVGVPYPKPDEMSPEWVRKHVGINEFILTPKELGSYEWQAGNLAQLPGGERAWVAGEKPLPDGGRGVELADGRVVERNTLSFVGQRAAIFAFTGENWSRNIQSDENFLYMLDPSIKEQYFEGKIDTRKGLVLPQFHRPTHVAPPLKQTPEGFQRVLVSVDQGFRHPTVALFAVELKKPRGGLFILKEYMSVGRSASENAFIIRGMVPVWASDVQYWADPSMWRVEATSVRSVADDYMSAGVPLIQADNNIARTVDQVRDYLTPEIDWVTGNRWPRLFISEECEKLIEAIETTTAAHMETSRENWIVDFIDSLRYLIAGASRLAFLDDDAGRESVTGHTRVWDYA